MGQSALIVGHYKIVTENAGGKNFWAGPQWPAFDSNNSGCPEEHGNACTPCIFDIFKDPSERNDLAKTDKGKQLLKSLTARLSEIKATAFSTSKVAYAGNETNCITNDEYTAAHNGFLGPLCSD